MDKIVRQDATPAKLLEMAIDKDLDIEKLERLMVMSEKWEAKQAKKAFLEALSKFQNLCPVLKKDKKVAFNAVKYNYTPLGSIVTQVKKALQECGLSYRWETSDAAGLITITCIVSHLDGHSENNTMSGAKDSSGQKNLIQQQGSTITYLQRYTLIGALGIATADDDVDGTGTPPPPENKKNNDILVFTRVSQQLKKCTTKEDVEIMWGSLTQPEQRIAAVIEAVKMKGVEIQKKEIKAEVAKNNGQSKLEMK